jgi:predicted lipoprotein
LPFEVPPAHDESRGAGIAAARAVIVAICCLLLATPAFADTTPAQYRTIVDGTIANYFRPEFARLEQETAALVPTVDGLCAAPSLKRLGEARTAFGAVVRAWSRVEYARLGPVIVDHRLERFSFWPDPKGIGLRQVQKLLADMDGSAADPATLAGKSVALQGLQALEFVLFGTGSDDLVGGEDFRCAYATAIAKNLDGIAEAIVAGWNDDAGYVALMENPGPDNPVYRSPEEPVGDIVEILTTGFQHIRDVKIGAFVGENPKKAKPRRAAFWRSGLAIDAIAANFAGLEALFEASGLVPVIETRPGGPGFVESVRFEFNSARENLDQGFPPVAEAAKDPDDHSRLLYLFIVANTLWKYFTEDISAALGLRAGFNALDGD